eukprot:scaffold940_cov569-Prasinococcus_capsulatus_cf.AAC.22
MDGWAGGGPRAHRVACCCPGLPPTPPLGRGSAFRRMPSCRRIVMGTPPPFGLCPARLGPCPPRPPCAARAAAPSTGAGSSSARREMWVGGCCAGRDGWGAEDRLARASAPRGPTPASGEAFAQRTGGGGRSTALPRRTPRSPPQQQRAGEHTHVV